MNMDLASRPTSQLHHTVDEYEMLSEGDGTRPVYKAGSVMLGGGGLRWDGIGEASGCPPRRRACLFCCQQDFRGSTSGPADGDKWQHAQQLWLPGPCCHQSRSPTSTVRVDNKQELGGQKRNLALQSQPKRDPIFVSKARPCHSSFYS